MGIQIRELVDWVRRRKVFASLLVVLTLGAGILIGTVISGHALANRAQNANGAALLAVPDPVQLSGTFSAIVTKLEPAVVNISTTQVIEKPKGGKRGGGNSLQDFFNHYFDEPDTGASAERSLGSGVIVDKRGYILTNQHVIDQATKIEVTFNGEAQPFTAKVIGADEETDLAVIKVEANRDLPTAQLGNSDGVQVGDWVLAFGSPFGLNSTVTAGIVSAKDRNNVGKQFQRFIQTDAAINPGNSGGPLVNLAGQVIGLNTAIYTGSRGFEGVGFALPSNTAIGVYNQLVTNGKVTRGAIGISFREDHSTNPVLLREMGAPYGIVVEGVDKGSPAEKSGLQPGDVITTVNGQPVHTASDLVDPISATAVGQSVRLGYVRNKKAGELTLTVADRSKIVPRMTENGNNNEESPGEAAPVQFGLHVQDLTPEVARRLGITGKVQGVVVSEVDPASFAEDLDFTRGDVIVEVNRVSVSNSAEYSREMAKLKPGQDIFFKVLRNAGDDRMLTLFPAGVVPNGQ
ncbi:MAG: Do family serine endopeptidase [Candidatus Acidiferrales bacterium]